MPRPGGRQGGVGAHLRGSLARTPHFRGAPQVGCQLWRPRLRGRPHCGNTLYDHPPAFPTPRGMPITRQGRSGTEGAAPAHGGAKTPRVPPRPPHHLGGRRGVSCDRGGEHYQNHPPNFTGGVSRRPCARVTNSAPGYPGRPMASTFDRKGDLDSG